ncbi:uncharacterized protein LOC135175771 [Pogoniulus pusillus]|uniref:uncharacterized protein LOC135175771 n=1 Tax=Pogoniulus pusillus TaxID=488313 RepID=UPI0030B99E41
MNALNWWGRKLRRKRKEEKAAAKAQRKAEKELRQRKDSVRGRLREQRASEQVAEQEQEPRPTPEVQGAQKEGAQNTTSLKAVSSSSSSSIWEQVAKNSLVKASSQDLTAVQESSAAVFPVRGVRSAPSMGCDAKKPFQSSQEWKEPGKEQSQDRSKQPQAVPVAPSARQPGPQARAQRLRSVGQKLRRRLARICLWLCLYSCCPCLQIWARKKQGVP